MIKSKKILVSGVSGQVGWELIRSCSLLGNVMALDRKEFDLSSSEKIKNTIHQYRPDILINAAAYTAVDKAESEPELCSQINAQAVGVMAEECKKTNAVFIHFSTDYVFNGEKTSPYLETDPVGPINMYGKSKLDGEKYIQSVGGDSFIYRVSWVYSHRGQNFVKTMLRLANQRSELKIVSDQWGTPTWAR
ncbi:MAG TPA: dTDP-4-dehydrorhamnose reductase, partial [Pseudobdellovibrionaceae bacterium]|nr:dTDP-4-dehydrorhamnose reductase [Pseudobdellovibrionaceae bacterium]